MAASRYMLKARGVIEPTPFRKWNRRVCDRCKLTLWGKKGHGFPSRDGKTIICGACKGG